MSEYISTNSGIQHQFRICYKRGKASQLWVSSWVSPVYKQLSAYANNRGTNKLIVELKGKSKNSTTRVIKNKLQQSIN